MQKHGCYELDRELVSLTPKDLTVHCPVHVHLEEPRSPNAHKVRSEEATARRRERRHDPERMKLKRAAKAQRGKENFCCAQRYHSDGDVLASVSRQADKRAHTFHEMSH